MILEKFKPLSNRLFVKRYEAAQVTDGGIIIPDYYREKPMEGTVISVGPGVKEVNVNDIVMFTKYAGVEPLPDYIVLSEDDILGVTHVD